MLLQHTLADQRQQVEAAQKQEQAAQTQEQAQAVGCGQPAAAPSHSEPAYR